VLFRSHKGLGHCIPIGVVAIGNEAPAQCIRAGDTRLQAWAGGGKALQPFEFIHDAETSLGAQRAGDLVFAALIVGWRTETARRSAFELNSGKVTIKGEIE